MTNGEMNLHRRIGNSAELMSMALLMIMENLQHDKMTWDLIILAMTSKIGTWRANTLLWAWGSRVRWVG
jgi:hypothetical protein